MRIRDILERQAVCLNATPVSKEAAISTLVDMMSQTGCLRDADLFRDAVFERERQSSTGFGEGIAIPHAKSSGVLRPSLATMVVPNGVEFEAFDDEPVHLIFLIASPHNASDAHLDVLARLSTLLMDESFRQDLLSAKTIDEYLDVIDRAEDAATQAEEAKEAEEDEDYEDTEDDVDVEVKEEQRCSHNLNYRADCANEQVNSTEYNNIISAKDEQEVVSLDNKTQEACIDITQARTQELTQAKSQDISQEQTQDTQTSSSNTNPKEHNKRRKKKKGYELVAVTACPAGLSHTYMAAEALEQKAKELGISIKVEADGAAGNRNNLLPEDIAGAKAVIVAADRAIDIDRFIGKRMVRTGVVDGVHKPEELIKRALDPNCPVYKAGSMLNESSNLPMRMYRHLMSGLTYILPLAATAGILAALARVDFIQSSSIGLFLDTISYSIGALLFPVLSAFIAFSMAGRMALVAGFTGGVMADMASAGVIGAVLNGFVGGGVAFFIARLAQRFLKGHDAMFALLVYPLAGAVCTTIIAQFVTNLPASLLDSFINNFIITASDYTLTIVGAILAGMMAADMGGPFNKLSYATGVLLLADCLPENGAGSMIMGCVMLGGMIPPIAAGCAAFCAPKYFSHEERNLRINAIIKGLLFITEAVIPYLAIGKQMRLACIAGSATAGALSMYFHCGVVAPHGGIFLMPIAVNQLYYGIALAGGAIVGTILFILLRIKKAKI